MYFKILLEGSSLEMLGLTLDFVLKGYSWQCSGDQSFKGPWLLYCLSDHQAVTLKYKTKLQGCFKMSTHR